MKKSPTLPLANLQKWMQQAIIGPSVNEPRPPVAFLPDEWKNAKLDDIVKPSKKLTSEQHLSIYQQSYILRLRACMSSQFKALEYALGENLFEGFVDQYLKTFPSESYTLMDLGANFRRFLEETRPDKYEEQKESWPDFMIELANFEFQINILFDKIEEPFTLAEQSTPDEQIKLIPVFEVYTHQFPIVWFYSSFIKGQEPEFPLPDPRYCVILRKNLRIDFFEINQHQFLFLRKLKNTGSVGLAKKTLGDDVTAVDAIWQEWKRAWVNLGFFRI
ncbi:MAG: DNA-binding domain-containing protein [Bacteroidota bacterium]